MSASATSPVFVVARGAQVVSPYFDHQADAFVELHRIESSMRSARLEPDVWVGQVARTTTYSTPERLTD